MSNQDSPNFAQQYIRLVISEEFTQFGVALENRIRVPLERELCEFRQELIDLKISMAEVQPKAGASKLQRLTRTPYEELVSLKRWRETLLLDKAKNINKSMFWFFVMLGSVLVFTIALILFIQSR